MWLPRSFGVGQLGRELPESDDVELLGRKLEVLPDFRRAREKALEVSRAASIASSDTHACARMAIWPSRSRFE